MQLPKYVEQVIDKLGSCGFEAYAIGGCVRDYLLSLDVFDYDVTTSATPDEVKAVLKEFKIIETGIAHGTVTALIDGHSIEITTFRGESGYTDCRHPDSVTFSKNIKDDLSRRDFTMNAIAYNENSGFIDHFGGKEDIDAGLIRAVGDADTRLREDALRILRALRFAAVLDFEIEERTKNAILKNYHLLSFVSKERIFSEFKRLICGKNAPRVLSAYYEIFNFVFSLSQERDFYLNAAKRIANLENGSYIDYLTALFFNLETEKIKTVLTLLKSDSATIKAVCTLVSIPNLSAPNKITVKKLLSQYSAEELINAAKLQLAAEKISESDAAALISLINEILEYGECYTISQLEISGTDISALGFKGAQIGIVLDTILNEVVSECLDNTKKELISFAKSLKN